MTLEGSGQGVVRKDQGSGQDGVKVQPFGSWRERMTRA